MAKKDTKIPQQREDEEGMFSVPGLIQTARARSGLKQQQFAKLVGTTQSLVSKYEKGTVHPPRRIIESCMNMVNVSEQADDLSAKALARRIRLELSSSKFADFRRTLMYMLDSIKNATPDRKTNSD